MGSDPGGVNPEVYLADVLTPHREHNINLIDEPLPSVWAKSTGDPAAA